MTDPEVTPLGDCRVIDVSSFLAGPFCSTQLAEFGAEVIKLELPKVGDALRKFGTITQCGDSLFGAQCLFEPSDSPNAKESRVHWKKRRKQIQQLQAKHEYVEDPLLLYSVLYGFFIAKFLNFDGDACARACDRSSGRTAARRRDRTDDREHSTGPVVIAAGKAFPADIELPILSDRHLLAIAVEDEEPRIGDGTADRNARRFRPSGAFPGSDIHRGLRWAVKIV